MTRPDPSGGRRPRAHTPDQHRTRLRRLLSDWRIVVPLAVAPLVLVAAATLWTRDSGPSDPSPPAAGPAIEDAPRGEASSQEPPSPSHQGGDTLAEELAETGTLGLVGEPASAGGLTLTVTEAAVIPGAGGRDQLVIFMTLANDSDDPQPYSVDGFTLIAERGAVVQPVPSRREDALESGTVEAGQSLSRTMEFPAAAGTHTLIYETAEGGDDPRVVWVIEA